MNSETKTFFWGHSRRYNDFPTYFKKKFEGRVQKVSINAGFSCPNRDGVKSTGGCNYCNNQTFQPSYCHLEKSITAQIDEGIGFFSRKYPNMRYLAYFQSYSNTYAPIENLKVLYEEALSHPQVIGLVIATRPDCLPLDVLDYLAELARKVYVMVELGVESCENETLVKINRGHTFEETISAFANLSSRGIHNCAHLILGLPGESKETMLNQARIISKLPIENLKLHQLQIHKGTKLAYQFKNSPENFSLFNAAEDYIELIVQYLELLNPKIIVERFVSQSPADLLIAPKWGYKNFEVVAKVEKLMEIKDTWQGRLYNK